MGFQWLGSSILSKFRRRSDLTSSKPDAGQPDALVPKHEPQDELSRRAVLEPLERRQLLSADLTPILGSIATPGESDRYSITITDPNTVYFDSQTDSGNLRWSLTGPGQNVADRPLSSTDGISVSNPPILDLVAGEYTLTVDGAADATGSYQFRLLDLGNATGITPGVSVSGTLDPGA